MKLFLKGIIIGIGGIAPGLSGSVLMVIFGLYQKVVDTIGNIFKDFKKNLMFLIPLFAGIGIGIVLFSKLVNYLLANYELYTRFAFLGLIVGTIPLFWREVRKEGWNNKYYAFTAIALAFGIFLFYGNQRIFEPVTNPTLLQSMILGFAVAGSSIVPGVDSAAILSSIGLYEIYVKSVAELNFQVLIPAVIGLGLGVLIISFIMSRLIGKFYTGTFSVILGLFLAIIPTVIKGHVNFQNTGQIIISILMFVIGFVFSIIFGNLEKIAGKKNKEKI